MSQRKIGKMISLFTALLVALLAMALYSDSVVNSFDGISTIGALAFLCGFFLLKAFFSFREGCRRSLHGLLKAGYILCFLFTLMILSVICVVEAPDRNSGFFVAVLCFVIGMMAHEVSQTDIHGGGWV